MNDATDDAGSDQAFVSRNKSGAGAHAPSANETSVHSETAVSDSAASEMVNEPRDDPPKDDGACLLGRNADSAFRRSWNRFPASAASSSMALARFRRSGSTAALASGITSASGGPVSFNRGNSALVVRSTCVISA